MPSIFVQIGWDIDEMIAKAMAAPPALRALAKDLKAVSETAAETKQALADVAEQADATAGRTGGPDASAGNNVGATSSPAGVISDITAGLLQQVGRR